MKMHGGRATSLAAAFLAILLVPVQFASADNNNLDKISKRHVQMVTPQPYIFDEYGPTNPLNPDGSDYPCKVPQGGRFQLSAGGTPTVMVAGEPQVASFAGTAVHGGGSCQFALAEGLAPTRGSAWKVIHSVEGGCPKANVEGNLEAGQAPDNYTFTVPDGFAPGVYTFAWTWVNRIAGAPEFYMNCAPVTVKAAAGGGGGSEREGREGSYPDLFLANIGDASNGCTTSEALQQQVAIAYPYPGDSVSRPDGADNLFRQPCDGNPRNANGSAVTGSGSGGESTSSSLVEPISHTAGGTSTSTGIASISVAQTTLSTSTGSPLPSTLDTSTSLPTSAASYSSQSSGPPTLATSTASAAGPSDTPATSSGTCTDGHLMCVGETQFRTCTDGEWTAPQELASNARCKEEGESVGLDITNVS